MIIRTTKELGNLLREARGKRGLTQTELANELGVSRHSVLRMEHGKSVGIDLLLKAAALLRLTLDVGLSDVPGSGQKRLPLDINSIVTSARREQR